MERGPEGGGASRRRDADVSNESSGAPGGAEPPAQPDETTDWHSEYCRVFAELQGAYGEISTLHRQVDVMAKALQLDADNLRRALAAESAGGAA